ncbi:TITAN-like protein-like [Hibiscus syriacus]|uniref:TITAN-like protein-like n=2 Tax=Hibiscus syriacus TaxID=106335 RepID=A0A6A3C0G1_HIBSY|nr:TITAN-like protein-like [Hibiscus syriacus]
MQLLPTCLATSDSSSVRYRAKMNDEYGEASSLDLQLSISEGRPSKSKGGVQWLRWQAAEQIRLAAIEKAYAERLRELTKREMEMAQSEFARANHLWQTEKEDAERAEK